MAETMTAALYHGKGDIRLELVPRPVPGPGEILVQVEGCGICGSDMRLYQRGPVVSMMDKWPLPRILGHEFTGKVWELGEGATGFKLGDRVSAAPATWCGHCFYCRHDAKALCLEPIDFGSTHPGALAEYVLIPALMVEQGGLVVVADDVSMEKASLLEPLGTCLRGLVTQGRLQPGQTVLVVGDGPIGLIQVMLAVHLGAGTVICAGHHSERLALALRFGARLVVNTLSKELRPIVLGETEGRGADLVLSAVPSHEALQECLDLVRGAGRLVIFGGVARGSTIQVDPNTVHYGETVITGSYNCTIEEFRQATELARHLPLQEIVDHRVPLLKIREGFDLMQERHSLKVLVTM